MLTVEENTPSQPQILGSTTLCNGASTTLSASANFPAILWSTGETTPQITVSMAGTIGLQVTDANGCSGTASVEVTVANSLSPQITAQAYACDGQLTLDAGAGFLTYSWSNGGASQTVVVSQNGTYEVTVSDAGGCTGTAVFNASIPAQEEVVITGDQSICTGDAAILTATAGFVGYVWSNGATTSATTITQPGLYSVTATDANGCKTVAAFPVLQDNIIPPALLGSSIICNGNPTTLFLTASYDNYLWSNGSTGSFITVATPGLVSVTVTDGNGCTATQAAEVLQENSFATFADTIEFVPGQVIPLVPPGVDFQPVEFTWSPTDILLDCDNCPMAKARPIEDVLVNYTAVSAAGCVQEGTFFLFFKDRILPSVYAPNAFSPDSPYNPTFTLFANDLVLEIKYLRIFTRWGEMVVELKSLTPNDPSKGWDGSFRGVKYRGFGNLSTCGFFRCFNGGSGEFVGCELRV